MHPRRSSHKRKLENNCAVAIAYLRVSTDDQGNGLEAQRDAIARFCASKSLEVVAWCTDQGVSGATPVDERSGLLEALRALSETGAGVLVAAKRDRFARDVVVAATLERMASNVGAVLLTADGIDGSATPEGQLLRTLIDAMASYERALIRSRTRAAMAIKKSRGECVGTAPFGFAVASDGSGKLVPVAHEQQALAMIREALAMGYSHQRICALLEAGHYKPRGSRWHKTTITRLAKSL